MRIDLNCDLGEGAAHDAGIMPWISSANVACGGHAGDDTTMRRTTELARRHGVAVGAHPGFPDRENFGRREVAMEPETIGRFVAVQLQALRRFGPVTHLKPHGALYHLAGRDAAVATAIARAAREADRGLVLVAAPGSELLRAGSELGLNVAAEGFVDRRYAADGSLLSREQPGAVIADADEAVAQGLRLVREGVVRTSAGTELRLEVKTLCVHGDNPAAPKISRRLAQMLQAAGIGIEPLRFGELT